MRVSDLFSRLKAEPDKIKYILNNIGMHDITDHGHYYSCGFPDGDNKKSCNIYKNSLMVEAYTRDIKDKNGHSNILSLVMFVKNVYFTKCINLICEICGYDFYNRDYTPPKLLTFLSDLNDMKTTSGEDVVTNNLIPINEEILKSYKSIGNILFYNDNISYSTQKMFELGYDLQSHRITIPIRDELGNLVGVKGRAFYDNLISGDKYIYLEPCAKSKILYGLHQTYDEIIKNKLVYVAESEKAVMQGWSHGIKNVVSIGGHNLSKEQARKLTHLGVEICLCYDDRADFVPKTVDHKIIKDDNGNVVYIRDNRFYHKEKGKFIESVKVSAIIDRKNEILQDKESPFDRMDRWEHLLKLKEIIV